MDDLQRFRLETRAWLEAHCPPSMRTLAVSEEEEVWGGRRAVYRNPEAREWLERMAGRGFTAPTWPREYGGAGLSPEEAKILAEEMRRVPCRPALASLGLWMLGPVMLRYATEALKQTHIPPMVRGEIRWCQGYSEPGAGSDLAGLQCRAVHDGDDFLVTGQKVWTSHANLADWIFCLVRTDPDAPKHSGITFLLIDMQTPGISVRPIKLISGTSVFCEVFFEHVRVPVTNVVGSINGGWEVARAVLNFERGMISHAGLPADGSAEIEGLARRYLGAETGPLPDPLLRDQVTRLRMDDLSFRLTLRRSVESIKAGRPPGPETSTFKLYSSELKQRRRDLMAQLAGVQGLGWEGESFTPEEIDLARQWLRSRATTIEGGSTEIQLNIIARRVLGLPD